MSAVRKLVVSGRVQAGTTVYLETVPVPFLQKAPLVQGEWLDMHLVELAEWGALVQAKGYDFKETEDDHPLASARFVKANGEAAGTVEIQVLRKRAASSLARFTGRTWEIEGRPHFRFQDYCAWRGRKIKGDLSADVQRGFLTASWNAWMNSCAGGRVAAVAGVPVTQLQCYAERYPRWTPPTGAEQELRQREQLLDDLRQWHSKRDREAELTRDWKDAAEAFLSELYIFQDAAAHIERRYFDGHQVMFPDVARDLAQVVGDTEKLVEMFNGLFGKMDPSVVADLEAVRGNAGKQAPAKTTYLVDMAKSYALEQMGEEQASMDLAGRYL